MLPGDALCSVAVLAAWVNNNQMDCILSITKWFFCSQRGKRLAKKTACLVLLSFTGKTGLKCFVYIVQLRYICIMQYMGATIIQRDKETWPDGTTVEMVVWAVDPSVPGCHHGYKYRLYAGRGGKTLVRYDNESGKGDHKHVGESETEIPYRFVSMDQTIRDFLADVMSARGES